MTKKFNLFKLKIINILSLLRLNFETKYYGFCYILFIILSIIISIDISYFIRVSDDVILNYKELYTNTGIAFIGLAGIIFTLQIFNQEVKNNYTNSVLQKILDIKFQHIVQYIYIIIITCVFIFIPNLNSFSNNLNFFIPFYYLTIIVVFIMFGIDLFVSTNKSNRLVIIKTIEKRIDYVLKFVEREYYYFEKYCKKENIYNPPLIDYISKANSIFIGYIQCINYILRSSINDPVLFSNGMETYVNIVKNRLSKRKNTFNYNYIPFLSDVLPHKDNDSFIEKYILEYLDEYAKIAVNTKNRDILSIIQQTYYSIIMVGKNNRYINNNGLELTIKVIFTYYLKTIKYVVEFDNDNMLFETLEIFKELFIKNSESFNDLIDIMFIDDIEEITSLALEKKSLMNFRNIQGLVVIPFYSILNSKDENKSYRIELLFNCLKKNLVKFATTERLIRRKDEGRTYLNYIFHTFESYSYHQFILDYCNNNIKDGKFVDNTLFDDDLLKPFVDFFNDDLVIGSLIVLENNNTYVTGFVNAKHNVLLLSQILINLIDAKEFNKIKYDNILLLNKCFGSIEKYSKRHNNNGMRCYEVDNFFRDLLNDCNYYVVNNIEISNLFFYGYYNCLKNVFIIDSKKSREFESFYKYINCIYNVNADINYINVLIDWYITLNNDALNDLYKIYKDLSTLSFCNERELSYQNKALLEELLKEKIEVKLRSLNVYAINDFIKKSKIDVKISLKKENKIELIIKKIRDKHI